MLIPTVSNATVDKQKGLQERQGGEGIIKVLERKRGTQPGIRTSQSCHWDQKGKTNNNQGHSGEQITAFPADASALLSNMWLSEGRKTDKRKRQRRARFKILYY